MADRPAHDERTGGVSQPGEPVRSEYEAHAEQQIREQAAYEKGYADGQRDAAATSCPWCGVIAPARHQVWCYCSAASRREIRAAYRVSDFEGMRVADKIRAFSQREALARLEQERDGYKRDFLRASERVELREAELALARAVLADDRLTEGHNVEARRG